MWKNDANPVNYGAYKRRIKKGSVRERHCLFNVKRYA